MPRAADMAENPFTERGRITNPEHFSGRWGELSLLFDRLEAHRPVLISGVPGIGKSSLLTHIVQSAAINLERPDLRAFYLDLRTARDTNQIYGTLIGALGERGDQAAVLELTLEQINAPILFCLDNVHTILAHEWGELLIETLARIARRSTLLLVLALTGTPPLLSERFATIGLGAFAATEIRLLAETYLEGSSVTFTLRELDELAILSAGHPAYLQRAAYHLFQCKQDPEYGPWQAAYLTEARERPIPGAPLPPAIFEGATSFDGPLSQYELVDGVLQHTGPQLLPIPEAPPILLYLLPLCLAGVVALVSSPPVAVVVALGGIMAMWFWQRRSA